MGSEFFWFLDILILAIVAAYIFIGAKRGAVGMLIGALSALIALIVASFASGVLSDIIYDRYIKEPLQSYITTEIGKAVNSDAAELLTNTDMSKARINGEYLPDISLSYDERNTAFLDLSVVDLSETGVKKEALEIFGISSDTDISAIKLGNLNVEKSDAEKYGLENIVLAQLLSVGSQSGDILESLKNIGDTISEKVPFGLGDMGEQLSKGSTELKYKFILPLLGLTNGEYGKTIVDELMKPVIITPLKTVLFFIIFALVMLILGIIANASKLINNIPVVSKVNGFFGALLGFAEAVIVIIIMCIVIKAIISVCSDSLVFINNTTIEKTIIFKHIYSLDPLKLL